jgi:signal transduction histidine kinase
MGLGLSLVKKILESYNGDIKVEDRVSGDYKQGSNFIIRLQEAK